MRVCLFFFLLKCVGEYIFFDIKEINDIIFLNFRLFVIYDENIK